MALATELLPMSAGRAGRPAVSTTCCMAGPYGQPPTNLEPLTTCRGQLPMQRFRQGAVEGELGIRTRGVALPP
jgi:hypothetical protein